MVRATTAQVVDSLTRKMGSEEIHRSSDRGKACSEETVAYKNGYSKYCCHNEGAPAPLRKEVLRRDNHKYSKNDVGFRALRIDTSNLADVFYSPDALDKENLDLFVDNIKPDRTPEDSAVPGDAGLGR